jgi:hypothetical protein
MPSPAHEDISPLDPPGDRRGPACRRRSVLLTRPIVAAIVSAVFYGGTRMRVDAEPTLVLGAALARSPTRVAEWSRVSADTR